MLADLLCIMLLSGSCLINCSHACGSLGNAVLREPQNVEEDTGIRVIAQPSDASVFTVPNLPDNIPEDVQADGRLSSRARDRGFVDDGSPRDCTDIQRAEKTTRSGAYTVFRPGCLQRQSDSCKLVVACDLQTDGGGWTVIQQRLNDKVSFFQNWKEYRDGFGDEENFWIGNEYLAEVTNMPDKEYQLLIQTIDFNNKPSFTMYDDFGIANEDSNYALTLGTMFGTYATDNMQSSRGVAFGTFDQDHDQLRSVTCGAYWRSGWWHDLRCNRTGDLNVPYSTVSQRTPHLTGIMWESDTGFLRLKSTQMKIRPKSFEP